MLPDARFASSPASPNSILRRFFPEIADKEKAAAAHFTSRMAVTPAGYLQFTNSDQFLDLIGLQDAYPLIQEKLRNGQREFSLGDSRFDGQTGGVVSIKTDVRFKEMADGHYYPDRITCRYLPTDPDEQGSGEAEKLFEIDLARSGRGAQLTLKGLQVRGEAMQCGPHLSEEQQYRIGRALAVFSEINSNLINLQFPKFRHLLKESGLLSMVGSARAMPGLADNGFSPSGNPEEDDRISFNHPIWQQPVSHAAWTPPQEFLREILGIGCDDFIGKFAFKSPMRKPGFDLQNGRSYECIVQAEETKDEIILRGDIMAQRFKPRRIKNADDQLELFKIILKKTPQGYQLRHLEVLGDSEENLPQMQRMQRLGIIHCIMKALRQEQYPNVLDYLAQFNHRHLIDPVRSEIRAEIGAQTVMTLLPVGGRQDRETLPQTSTIGANCDIIWAHWRADGGHYRRMGVVRDFGVVFTSVDKIVASRHGDWDTAMPDIVEFLKDIEHFFITHNHQDHMGAVKYYAKRGLMVGKTVHLSAHAKRNLEDELTKMEVPKKLWPTINAMADDGFVHLAKDGQRRLSVYCAMDAIPHSTDNSGFFFTPPPYPCDEEGRKLTRSKKPMANPHYWALLNTGDSSFPEYYADGYRGEIPPDREFNDKMIVQFRDALLRDYPDMPEELKARIAKTPVDLVELDVTSVHRQGATANVLQVEKNLRILAEEYDDFGMLVVCLSTAKRMQKMMMRLANYSQRMLSALGTNMVQRMTDMNVVGVDRRVLPPREKGNINAYMEWHAGQVGVKPSQYITNNAEKLHDVMTYYPGRIIMLMTGSQGTAVEKDAIGAQVAEGRSRFDLDPTYCSTTYGVDIRKCLVLYAQSAIPGNEETQLSQVRTTAYKRDIQVALAGHEGSYFFNLKEPNRSRLMNRLRREGYGMTPGQDGEFFIPGFWIYPPGHGQRQDMTNFMKWLKRQGVGMINAMHYARDESVKVLHEIADKLNIKHPEKPTRNFDHVTMLDGEFRFLGRHPASYVMARLERKTDKYFGGTLYLRRLITQIGSLAHGLSSLVISRNEGFIRDFPSQDYEATRVEQYRPPVRQRRNPDHAVTLLPPALTVGAAERTRAIRLPGTGMRAHPLEHELAVS